MADLYFGKLTNDDQVEEKCYRIIDGKESWLNGLSEGDYSFILNKGNVVGLWKCIKIECNDNNIDAHFEEVYKVNNLRTFGLEALTIFKPNLDLLNKSSNPSKYYGFFKLHLFKCSIEDILKEDFFRQVQTSMRKICFRKNDKDAINYSNEHPDDIVIYKDSNGKVSIVQHPFLEEELYNNFNNSQKAYIKNCRYEEILDVASLDPASDYNRVIAKINNAFEHESVLTINDLSFEDLYNIFFATTDYRKTSSKRKKTEYWIFRHKSEDESENDRMFDFAKKHKFGFMQYEFRADQQNDRGTYASVKKNINKAAKIKEGDIIFFQASDSLIYAFGKVIMPRESADLVVDYPNENINSITNPNQVIHFKGLPLYQDFKNDYFSSVNWRWGQRIDVEEWINNTGKPAKAVNYSVDRSTFNKIDETEAKRIMKELGDPNMLKNEYANILEKVYNMVLTGAPGTGKTYLARQIALELTTEDKIEKVQFHPSFDYTDFVEGLRPVKYEAGIAFKRKDGIFKKLCRRAKDDPYNKYVLIIDEINRGDISKIFGELFSSIEADYRDKKYAITTQYNNLFSDRDENEWDEPKFYVPNNLFIIGTMNDIDRSVESMDFAIRRRFTWIEIKASENLSMLNNIEEKLKKKCISKMTAMNTAICDTPELGPAYEIGGAYFKKIDKLEGTDEERFNELWQYYLEPIIKEYLRGVLNSEAFVKIKDAYDQS